MRIRTMTLDLLLVIIGSGKPAFTETARYARVR